MTLRGEYSYGQTYTQDDKKYTVISNSCESDYITVKDENGNVICQKKYEPIFKYQADQEAKRDEQIAYYRQKAEEAGEQKSDWMSKIKELWTQMANIGKNDPEYTALKDEYWAARFAKVAAGNREYSAYLSAFMVASDPIV